MVRYGFCSFKKISTKKYNFFINFHKIANFLPYSCPMKGLRIQHHWVLECNPVLIYIKEKKNEKHKFVMQDI